VSVERKGVWEGFLTGFPGGKGAPTPEALEETVELSGGEKK